MALILFATVIMSVAHAGAAAFVDDVAVVVVVRVVVYDTDDGADAATVVRATLFLPQLHTVGGREVAFDVLLLQPLELLLMEQRIPLCSSYYELW